MSEKKSAGKKNIRYIKWTIKIAILLILILPIRFFQHPGVYQLPVYSLAFGGYTQPPLTILNYGQSVCSFLLFSWSYVGPGGWIICPLGGLQVLLTLGHMPQGGLDPIWLTICLASAILIFFLAIFLLGPIFCSWICPVGTVVDGFDKGVEKFMPKLNKRRVERQKQNLKKNKKKSRFACPTCPFGNFLANKIGWVANGLIVGALGLSFWLKFPVFCSICPIGITSQGMFHLKSVTYISREYLRFTHIVMPVLIELWIFPVVAILLSLREKRYWCRIICPVGALVRFFGKFNPFLKLTVKTAKQVEKERLKTGEGNGLAYCADCSTMDQRTCERVCPQCLGPLKAKGSAECTKCFECYVECKNDMIQIKRYQTPEVVSWYRRVFKKRKEQPKKQNK